LGPVSMFCAPGLVFGYIGGVGSRFHVSRARTRFRRYRGCQVPFSYFAVLYSFSAFPRASGTVIMFCVPGLIFGGTEGAGSHFRRCRVRRVPFSCFDLTESFSAVQRVPGPVFMFCSPGLVFSRTEGIWFRFHVLRSQARFRRYGGRRVSISCFALAASFSAVPRASVPVFIFCAPGLFFGGTEGVGSRFHVFRSQTRFRRNLRASGPVFIFCAPVLVLGDTEGVGSRCHVLRVRTPFSAVPRASDPVFMFCAPGLVFGDAECLGSRFHVFISQTRFRRLGGCRVPFPCFARPDSFSVVPRASGPIFMFCALGLIFGGTEVSSLDFMFCAPRLIFGGTEGVGSRFHVLRARNLFRRY
jgi:hypothetical protein